MNDDTRKSYMPIWDDTWEALMLINDEGERWAVLAALREYGKSGTIPDGLSDIQKAVFIASKHGVKFKKKAGAPTGNSNASKNNDETTLKQYCFNVETIENNSFNNKNNNKNSNLNDDDIRAREEISSSSSSENFVLGDFDKLCDEMLSANGTFAANVRTMNPRYNVTDEKFNGWVDKFRHYKHTVGDDGLKSRNDVRKNFINWLRSQVKAEDVDCSTSDVEADFSDEQKARIGSVCGIPYHPTAINDLKKYMCKCNVPPETAVEEYVSARANGYGHFELQRILSSGGRLPKEKRQ